ncbi:Hypothetical protein NTJ_01779 [Nesidiocoris tenuis]|uniref:Uncharacterized protein n=1 Tax=Nesidiocoris tenuis TaxID=355587 RepID=A0ABN7AFB0_9HEMI|nr:Hypothetical protein NTJ_01779 [Nesidiocoris tenuis]
MHNAIIRTSNHRNHILYGKHAETRSRKRPRETTDVTQTDERYGGRHGTEDSRSGVRYLRRGGGRSFSMRVQQRRQTVDGHACEREGTSSSWPPPLQAKPAASVWTSAYAYVRYSYLHVVRAV